MRRIEWPTVGVALLCYASYWAATVALPGTSLWLSVALLSATIALHSSLQHEVLHGHPFPNRVLSEAMVFPAIGLCVPYVRFRDLHLAHHRDANLTDPYDDPESNYLDPVIWRQIPEMVRVVLRWNNTLAGRIVIGPAIGLAVFYIDDARRLRRGDLTILRAYAWHGLSLLPVLWWMVAVSELPPWAYLMAAYFGLSILRVRTYLEHRAHATVQGRTVIIEDKGPLAFLFLNNNYHLVHHANPKAPWYRLPTLFREKRESYLQRNRGYHYASYLDVFRRHLLQAKDPVPHPFGVAKTPRREHR